MIVPDAVAVTVRETFVNPRLFAIVTSSNNDAPFFLASQAFRHDGDEGRPAKMVPLPWNPAA